MPTSKQLEKLDKHAELVLPEYNIANYETKYVKNLEVDPGLQNKEMAVLLPTTIPLMMAGFFAPLMIELQTGYDMGSMETLSMIGGGTASFLVLAIYTGVFRKRIIRNAFKYDLGYKLKRDKVTKLRHIQKALEPGETKIIPASEIFETSEVIDFAASKGYEIDILVSTERVALQWGKPADPGNLWDEAINDLVEIFQLKGHQETGQNKSLSRKMSLKLSNLQKV